MSREIRNTIIDVRRASDQRSALLPSSEEIISAWEKADCIAWSKALKLQPQKANDPAFLPELVAVVYRASQLATGFEPRFTQLMTLVVLLESKEHGRLAQVATGEGKSTITAMFAAVKAFQGETVDIITSSPVLAMRDAANSKTFFDLFEITVSHNCYRQDCGFKDCYRSDIVFGTISDFQFDLLRHEYQCENTRGDRVFQTVIADEVDSMLIDESMKIASLGCYKPSMENLEPLLVSTWTELLRVHKAETFQDSEAFEEHIKNYIIALLDRTDSPILIPHHLKSFAKRQAIYYAKSAITAFYVFEENKHYVVTEEGITPIDYLNTGVTRVNSAWDDGLHQFLQIKHGVSLTAENVTASFMSNVTYFKRYGNNIFGLTGTLGTVATKRVLEEIYSVDIKLIPVFKSKMFTENPGVLVENSAQWIQAIISGVKREISAHRAVLIICETIQAVLNIEEALRLANVDNIKRYTRSDCDDEAEVVSQKLKPGDIIIATNLAGRGTDIKTTDELESNGGLHVCVTFLAHNCRVEEQAFGRTARQGNKGSAQLIINKEDALKRLESDYPTFGNAHTIENLKAWRDAVDHAELLDAQQFHLKKIIFKDSLFSNFCEFTHQLRGLELNHFKLNDIEERWGFWLKETDRQLMQEAVIDEAAVLASLENFKAQLWREYTEICLQNPCQWIKYGNHYARIADYEKAIDAYTRAIGIDPHFAAQAYYNRASAHIMQKASNYKSLALSDLQSARSCIVDDLIPQLQTEIVALQNADTTLIRQLNKKIELLQTEIQHIDAAIQKISSYDGDIDIDQATSLANVSSNAGDVVRELYDSGLFYFFTVKEVIPEEDDDDLFSWVRRAGVFLLGVCQIVVGTCLMVTGNVYWGKAAIEMGVSDIMFAVRSALEGTQCKWSEYRAHKVVSSAIILATIGIDIIREARVSTAARESVKKSTTLFELAKEKVGQAIVISGATEVCNYAIGQMVKVSVRQFESDIEDTVRSKIHALFNDHNFQLHIDRILSANINCAADLQKDAANIVEPRRNAFHNTARAICEGVLANQHPLLRTAITAAKVLEGIDRINQLCSDFCDEYRSKMVERESQLTAGITLQDHTQTRDALRENIIRLITRYTLNKIQNDIAYPIAHHATSKFVNDIASGMCRRVYDSYETLIPTQAELEACRRAAVVNNDLPIAPHIPSSALHDQQIVIRSNAPSTPKKPPGQSGGYQGRKPVHTNISHAVAYETYLSLTSHHAEPTVDIAFLLNHAPVQQYFADLRHRRYVETMQQQSRDNFAKSHPVIEGFLKIQEYSAAVHAGATNGISHVWTELKRDLMWSAVIKPTLLFVRDGYVLTYQDHLPFSQETKQLSHTRMQDRAKSVNQMIEYVANASGPERAEIAAQAATEMWLTGKIIGFVGRAARATNRNQLVIKFDLLRLPAARNQVKDVTNSVARIQHQAGNAGGASSSPPGIIARASQTIRQKQEVSSNLQLSQPFYKFSTAIPIAQTSSILKRDFEFEWKQVASGSIQISWVPSQPFTMFYRGDSRAPNEIFQNDKNGFIARGQNTNLEAHLHPHRYNFPQDSAYIPLTKSKHTAMRYASRNGFVYRINPQNHGIDIETSIASEWMAEREIAVPFRVLKEDIEGAWPVKKSFIGRPKLGEFIPNPDYVCPFSKAPLTVTVNGANNTAKNAILLFKAHSHPITPYDFTGMAASKLDEVEALSPFERRLEKLASQRPLPGLDKVDHGNIFDDSIGAARNPRRKKFTDGSQDNIGTIQSQIFFQRIAQIAERKAELKARRAQTDFNKAKYGFPEGQPAFMPRWTETFNDFNFRFCKKVSTAEEVEEIVKAQTLRTEVNFLWIITEDKKVYFALENPTFDTKRTGNRLIHTEVSGLMKPLLGAGELRIKRVALPVLDDLGNYQTQMIKAIVELINDDSGHFAASGPHIYDLINEFFSLARFKDFSHKINVRRDISPEAIIKLPPPLTALASLPTFPALSAPLPSDKLDTLHLTSAPLQTIMPHKKNNAGVVHTAIHTYTEKKLARLPKFLNFHPIRPNVYDNDYHRIDHSTLPYLINSVIPKKYIFGILENGKLVVSPASWGRFMTYYHDYLVEPKTKWRFTFIEFDFPEKLDKDTFYVRRNGNNVEFITFDMKEREIINNPGGYYPEKHAWVIASKLGYVENIPLLAAGEFMIQNGRAYLNNYSSEYFNTVGSHIESLVLSTFALYIDPNLMEFSYVPGTEILDPQNLPSNVVLPKSTENSATQQISRVERSLIKLADKNPLPGLPVNLDEIFDDSVGSARNSNNVVPIDERIRGFFQRFKKSDTLSPVSTQLPNQKAIVALLSLSFFSSFIDEIFPATFAAELERFKTCAKQDFSFAQDVFSQVSAPSDIAELTGGRVADNINSNVFQNFCALRISHVLNEAGCKIPVIQNNKDGRLTVSAKNGEQYIFRVNVMKEYLTKHFNSKVISIHQFKHPSEYYNYIEERSGIYFKKINGSRTCNGHFGIKKAGGYSYSDFFWEWPVQSSKQSRAGHKQNRHFRTEEVNRPEFSEVSLERPEPTPQGLQYPEPQFQITYFEVLQRGCTQALKNSWDLIKQDPLILAHPFLSSTFWNVVNAVVQFSADGFALKFLPADSPYFQQANAKMYERQNALESFTQHIENLSEREGMSYGMKFIFELYILWVLWDLRLLSRFSMKKSDAFRMPPSTLVNNLPLPETNQTKPHAYESMAVTQSVALSTPGNSLFSPRHLTIEEIANRIHMNHARNPALPGFESGFDRALVVSSKSVGASRVPTLADFCEHLNLPQTGPMAFKAKVDSYGNSVIEKNQYNCIIDLYGNLWKYSPGNSLGKNYIPGHWDVILSEATLEKLREYNKSIERHNKENPHDQKRLFVFRPNKYGIGYYVNVVAETETNLRLFAGPGFPHH